MTPTRRVLVAARHLALDRTSEGLCTARLVQALIESGHEVRCLTTEPASGVTSAPDGDAVVRVSAAGSRLWERMDKIVDPSRAATTVGRRLRSLAGVAVAVGMGASPASRSEVVAWRRAIRRHRRTFAPDVVIARGGGLGFEPHLALATRRHPGPWIAHYHDPYPLSAYPPSYAHHTPLLSAREERGSRQILQRASLVTFPSRQLADWTERSSGVDLGGRRSVLANIGGHINDEQADTAVIDRLCGDRPFLLVHTGTLLRQRSPLPLLRAFRRLLADGDEQATQSRLVLLGSVDRSHRADAEFLALRDELASGGNLGVDDARTGHATAFGLACRATATVLIEADDPESPFFPAKLADYLMADRPILALSPPRSVARDLLGVNHPLWCPPGDEDAILTALRTLWTAWRAGRLDDLRAPPDARTAVSPGHAVAAVDELVERAIGQPTSRRWRSPAGAVRRIRRGPGPARIGSPP